MASKKGKKQAEKQVSKGEQILNLLEEVERPGSFCTGSRIDPCVLPGLTIKGVGKISLPLLPVQAQEIIPHCSLAPFGKKEKTIYDKAVRNSWQMDPSEFSFSNENWNNVICGLIPMIKVGLGIGDNIKVQLQPYKLLLYETGGFFKRHRDTEKENGMFGTLAVILPSTFEGGELEVRHNGEAKSFDFSAAAEDNFHYIAFYGDCEHEIKPVTKGHRLALVYNMIYTGTGLPAPASNLAAVSKLRECFSSWTKNDSNEWTIILEHQYSKHGLDSGMIGLKGKDRARVEVLREAISQLPTYDISLLIGTITVTESGSASGSYGYYGSTSYDMEEVDDREIAADTVSLDGKIHSEASIDEDYIVPEGALEDVEWDKEDVEEATGNEGASMSRWYRTSAIFLEVYPPEEEEEKEEEEAKVEPAPKKQKSNKKAAKKR